MFIDVIVPNFDDKEEEVLISSWYKKVGDKISNGEVIADAETLTMTCGITSGYDCFLSKIFVKEGETAPQGSKIAVIEVDVDKPSVFPESEEAKHVAKEELKRMDANEEKRLDNAGKTSATSRTTSAAESGTDLTTSTAENEAWEEPIIRRPRKASEQPAMPTEHHRKRQISSDEQELLAETDKYNLSVYGVEEDRRLTTKEDLAEIVDEFETEAEEMREEIDDVAKSINEIENVAEEIKEVEQAEIAEEHKILKKVIDDEKAMKEVINEALPGRAEEKFMQILKDAEAKANAEAEVLKNRILEEARAAAVTQGEKLKSEILKDYEERASKDASEMHRKIIEGSLAEAESTKNRLINEAREDAKREAETLKKHIRDAAQRDAQKEAEDIKKAILHESEQEAKNEAETFSKKIIEQTIHEANEEAREIKKDILKSANRHAKKNANELIKKIIKNSVADAEHEADLLRDRIAQEARKEAFEETEEVLLESERMAREKAAKCSEKILEKAIDRSVEESADETVTREFMESAIAESKVKARAMAREIFQSVSDQVKKKYERILKDESQRGQSKRNSDEIISAVLREIDQSAEVIKKEIMDKTRSEIADILFHSTGVKSSSSEGKHHEQAHRTDSSSSREPNDTIDSESDEAFAENRMIRKLMHAEDERAHPEMYADNWKKPKFFYSPEDQRENLDLLRKRISEKMNDAYDSSVISTVSNEVDMTAILSLERTFGQAFSQKYNTRLGFTPFFIMAAVEALKRYRVFNAHIREDEIIYKKNFDISVITCGNDGISAPVIRQVDSLNFAEIEKKMITLSRRAVEGTLSLEEVSDGTFTVVNAGIYGSLMGTDILTPPQVATLSVHKMHNRPIATDEGVEVKPMLYISLSYDHRVADTKLAAEFLSNVKDYVENPGWQLLGL